MIFVPISRQEQEDTAQHHLSLMYGKTEIFNELKNKSSVPRGKSRRHNEENPGADSTKGSTQTAGETKQQKGEGESQISHFWRWGDAS